MKFFSWFHTLILFQCVYPHSRKVFEVRYEQDLYFPLKVMFNLIKEWINFQNQVLHKLATFLFLLIYFIYDIF